jgi:hypothetical protein
LAGSWDLTDEETGEIEAAISQAWEQWKLGPGIASFDVCAHAKNEERKTIANKAIVIFDLIVETWRSALNQVIGKPCSAIALCSTTISPTSSP